MAIVIPNFIHREDKTNGTITYYVSLFCLYFGLGYIVYSFWKLIRDLKKRKVNSES